MLGWIAILILTILFSTTAYSYLLAKAKRWGMIYPTALFSGLTILANIFAVQFVQLGPLLFPIAVIPYAITFTITDITDEVLGRKPTHHIVWAAGILNIVAAAVIWLSINVPAAPNSVSFRDVLTITPRVFAASAITFFISQHHDVWAFHFWRQKTEGKYLWLRNNASTSVSQLIDTVLFFTLAFGAVLPWSIIAKLIFSQYLIKLLIAIADTPFVYLGVKIFNRFHDANY